MGQNNIIFILTDQQRWDTLGCYGQELPVSPNIDSMASEGVLFQNTFTCQPLCGPARASLQTGKYPTEVGCHTNHIMLPIKEKTIANILSENGYEVGYIGKWHLGSFGPAGGPDDFRIKPIPLERRGGYKDLWLVADVLEFTSNNYEGHVFDADGNKVEFPGDRYRVDLLTDWALDYIRTRESKKPFFLFISYLEPHHQNGYDREPPFHYEGPEGHRKAFENFLPPGDLKGLTGDWKEEFPDYLACINSIDENVGRIRATIKELGIENNTSIIFTSDHGSHFRTRNREYKRSSHDGCVRIPLVIQGPGFSGGKIIEEMVNLIDFPSTILAEAGITPPDWMRGQPLQELVDGKPSKWREGMLIQISESHCGRAIRTRKWKYSVRAPDVSGATSSSQCYEEDYLYDLEADPHERENLVLDERLSPIRQRLARLLIEKMVEIGEEPPEIKQKNAGKDPRDESDTYVDI